MSNLQAGPDHVYRAEAILSGVTGMAVLLAPTASKRRELMGAFGPHLQVASPSSPQGRQGTQADAVSCQPQALPGQRALDQQFSNHSYSRTTHAFRHILEQRTLWFTRAQKPPSHQIHHCAWVSSFKVTTYSKSPLLTSWDATLSPCAPQNPDLGFELASPQLDQEFSEDKGQVLLLTPCLAQCFRQRSGLEWKSKSSGRSYRPSTEHNLVLATGQTHREGQLKRAHLVGGQDRGEDSLGR
ncbi:uncharacterized protein LOC119234571 isoform X3 [Talpa occidentalis]|uniref:uncharacterized protein LOC119234571 isoform X3 n=1 Tax=Talpa occidentalis TaxID=50954 RepID=UPI0023F64743|nr:uncharacterized protein LOC119234571 isoform X3 [Talpa occidentalis]